MIQSSVLRDKLVWIQIRKGVAKTFYIYRIEVDNGSNAGKKFLFCGFGSLECDDHDN